VSEHERFRCDSLASLERAIDERGLELPLAADLSVLGEPVAVGGKSAPNRLAVQPMEGCDGSADGRPGELTVRRYRRFAAGGAGLLWFEATAVAREGRSNPRQLLLTDATAEDLGGLLRTALDTAAGRFGADFRPYTVLQLTHSGRYSRPDDVPAPVAAVRNPHLEANAPDTIRIIEDGELEALEDRYADAALMARDMGFDAVDVKSCHRYLVSELLSAHTRDGAYGGSFGNRTRFLLNVVDKIRDRTGGGIAVTPRLNVYDAIPHPFGWGVDRHDHRKVDLDEPIRLVRMLADRGVPLVNVTAGNPYFNPHVNRPYDTGPYLPPEHPLEGVARLLGMAREIRRVVPGMLVVASGLTWLREYGANVAAGGVREGWFDFAGFGRQAFAYPDFAADILESGGMKRGKCCIACGKCSEIMRFDGRTGCVIRDADPYRSIYREASAGKPPLAGKHTADHV